MTSFDWDRVETLARECWQQTDSPSQEDFSTGFYAGYMYGAHDLPTVDQLAEAMSAAMGANVDLENEHWAEYAREIKQELLAALPKQSYDHRDDEPEPEPEPEPDLEEPCARHGRAPCWSCLQSRPSFLEGSGLRFEEVPEPMRSQLVAKMAGEKMLCGELPWGVDDPAEACVQDPAHEGLHHDFRGRWFVSRSTIEEAEELAKRDEDEGCTGEGRGTGR